MITKYEVVSSIMDLGVDSSTSSGLIPIRLITVRRIENIPVRMYVYATAFESRSLSFAP